VGNSVEILIKVVTNIKNKIEIHTLSLQSWCCMLQLLVTTNVPSSPILVTLMMEMPH
jgi:hypothetical protein